MFGRLGMEKKEAQYVVPFRFFFVFFFSFAFDYTLYVFVLYRKRVEASMYLELWNIQIKLSIDLTTIQYM